MKESEVIGNMNRRVTIQQKVYGEDASNQRLITGWENISEIPKVWAHVNERSGTEVFQNDQLVAVTVAEITIKYRSDLTVENRIIYNSKYYDITALIEVNTREFLKITCESGGQYS